MSLPLNAAKDLLAGRSVYLLRNADTQAKGLGFARAGNFYPDFLLWLVDDATGERIEPSAAAGFGGPAMLTGSDSGRAWLAEQGLQQHQAGMQAVENPDRESFSKIVAAEVEKEFVTKFGGETLDAIKKAAV